MFLKSSVSFLLLFCFVSYNLATPASRIRRDVNKNIEQIANEIETSVKTLVQNSGWIFNNSITIVRNIFQEGLQNAASWMVDLVVRFEFLSMADGSHMYFPLNGKSEIEQEYKTVAIAVSKLLMNLKTMERTDVVLKNVTRHLITKDVESRLKDSQATPEKVFRTFLHMYFEKLDHHMEADEDLRAEYKQWKIEAREMVKRDPKMLETPFKLIWESSPQSKLTFTDENIKNFLKDKQILCQAFANKVFMHQSVKHFTMIFSALHHQRYLLARTLIQKARSSSSDSKINELYHQALVRVAESVYLDKTYDDIANELFKSIESVLESDPTLNTEIRATMKQIEGSTVYDADMFYIDFSYL